MRGQNHGGQAHDYHGNRVAIAKKIIIQVECQNSAVYDTGPERRSIVVSFEARSFVRLLVVSHIAPLVRSSSDLQHSDTIVWHVQNERPVATR